MANSNFPAWFYGPDGQARIFEEGEKIPEGWASHPRDVFKPAPVKTAKKVKDEF